MAADRQADDGQRDDECENEKGDDKLPENSLIGLSMRDDGHVLPLDVLSNVPLVIMEE